MVVCIRIGASGNIDGLCFVSGLVGGKHTLVGQDDHASSGDLQGQVGRIESGRTKHDRMVGVHGVQSHGAGRCTSVESDDARGVCRGALIDEHVRRAVNRSVSAAPQGFRFGPNLPDGADVLVQVLLTVVALGGVAPHVTVVGICSAVLTVFIAHVDHRCAGNGQQPGMGLQGGGIGFVGAGLARKTLLGPLVPLIGRAGVGARGEARDVVAADEGHHDRTVHVLVLAAGRPVIEVHVVLFAGGEDAV